MASGQKRNLKAFDGRAGNGVHGFVGFGDVAVNARAVYLAGGGI
jgi:hypothetical protein